MTTRAAGTPAGESPTGRILVVEDRASLRRLMQRALGQQGHQVTVAGSVAEAQAVLPPSGTVLPFDLVLSDLRLPDGTGLDVLRGVRELERAAAVAPLERVVPFVVLTAYADVQSAVQAMKMGADEYLEKPVGIDELCELAERMLAAAGGSLVSSSTSADVAAPQGEDGLVRLPGGTTLVAGHPRMREALRLVERVAPTDGTVLLLGESGTGKELFARAVHELSRRSGGPFLALNCAAVPEALVESELFGHEKGAFTGAGQRRPGRFERARSGTLFLDEIGELQPDVQAKLLRVLESGEYERVGGASTLRADVRVVAATNVDLRERVEQGRFRADLLFRLDIFPLRLPPLRDRGGDVVLLARHLLREICARDRLQRRELGSSAAQRLLELPWPGNVRQLANVLERAALLTDERVLGRGDLDRALRGVLDQVGMTAPGGASQPAGSAAGAAAAGPESASERQELLEVLRETDGDKKLAAERLGISYRTLQRRVVRWDLEGFPRYRDA